MSSLTDDTDGKVHVLFGNGTALDLERSILPTSIGPAFGQAMASGDLNCDGSADLVVSNTGSIDSPVGYSAIEVFHGSATGYNGTPDRMEAYSPPTKDHWERILDFRATCWPIMSSTLTSGSAGE